MAVLCAIWLLGSLNAAALVQADHMDEEPLPERGLDLSALGDLLGGSLPGGSSSGGGASEGNDGSLSTLETLSGLLDAFGLGTRNLRDCECKAIPDKTYTGKAICPVPVITWKGQRLKKGQDYTVTYSDNIRVGTAKCRITGKGNYKGTRTLSFKIVRKDGKGGSAAGKGAQKKGSFKITLSKTSYVYNGSPRKPSVKVTSSGKAVPANQYTVTYKNNRSVGVAWVTVKGKGAYSSLTGEASFKITLKAISLKSVSSPSAGELKATWNPDSQSDGYEVQACTNQSFSSGTKKAEVQGSSKKTWSFDGLKGQKQYYVRIRSYKEVGKDRWTSTWSKPKTVKVK